MGEQFSFDLQRLAQHLARIQAQIDAGDVDGGLAQLNELRQSMERYAAYWGCKEPAHTGWGFAITIGDLSAWQQAVESLNFDGWDDRDTEEETL